MNKAISFVSGVGLGVGLMYMMDPDMGLKRRERTRRAVRSSGEFLRTRGVQIGTQAAILASKARDIADAARSGNLRLAMGRPRRRRRRGLKIAMSTLGGAAAAYAILRQVSRARHDSQEVFTARPEPAAWPASAGEA